MFCLCALISVLSIMCLSLDSLILSEDTLKFENTFCAVF